MDYGKVIPKNYRKRRKIFSGLAEIA